MKRVLPATVMAILLPWLVSGQERFAAASVKPNESGDARSSIGTQPNGRLTATNVTVRTLLAFAYRIQEYRILGGEEWTHSQRFDVIATAGRPLSVAPRPDGQPTVMQQMLRDLLADRFGLVTRTETRTLPVYNLVVEGASGPRGSRIRPSSMDCRSGGAPAAPGQRPSCGMRLAPGLISAGSRSLKDLADTLADFVQRPVIDRTGVQGGFDFDLAWAYEPPTRASSAAQDIAADPNAPDLFTAVREQLGVRLQADRAPVGVIVIDRASHPAPD